MEQRARFLITNDGSEKTPAGLPLKLAFMIAGRDQGEVAEQAKISAAAFSAYMTGKSKPTADAAVRLAKALACDLEWLLDDARAINEPFTPRQLSVLPDEYILLEVRNRYFAAAIQVRESLLSLDRINWVAARDALEREGIRVSSDDVVRAASAVQNLQVRWMEVGKFALRRQEPGLPDPALPSGVATADLSIESLEALEHKQREKLDGFVSFLGLLGRTYVRSAESEKSRAVARRRSAKRARSART